jgi:asparagine synthase (glutamine-hydrolysing)
MCGVAAQFSYHYAGLPVDRAGLEATLARMSMRGPDGQGIWVDAEQRVALGHRRLAIIDLDARADQPMHDALSGNVISFNGEIYNYRALREELERAGVSLRTASDTEVVLHLFRREGWNMLRRLRGMYAFALWEASTRRLWLVRDALGIKPLYYVDDGWCVRAASSVNALRADPHVSGDLEPAGVVGFFLFGSVPEPHTLFRGVRAVPAGHRVCVDGLGAGAPQPNTIPGAEQSPAGGLVDVLSDSVRAHQVADVPVGVLLSGGMDSCALLAMAREHAGPELEAVTLHFPEFRDRGEDEVPVARACAAHLGVRHHVQEIGAADFHAALPRLLADMDQPTVDGMNTWLVSRAARAHGWKVAISGVGGDEIFGSYPSFRTVPRLRRWGRPFALLPGVRSLLRRGAEGVARAMHWHPKLPGAFELAHDIVGAYLLARGVFLPWELQRLLPRDFVVDGLRRLAWRAHLKALDPGRAQGDRARVAALEMGQYLRNQLLRDADWAGMAHSLEIRTPLVDAAVFASLSGPSARLLPSKRDLVAAMRGRLPESVLQRPKYGFSMPLTSWMTQGEALSGWRRYRWLGEARQHWSRRLAVGVFDHFVPQGMAA